MNLLNKIIGSSVLFFLLNSSVVAGQLLLKHMWDTEPVLQEPESVVYDIIRRSLYVSNINGSPGAFDSNGYIALVSDDGTVDKLKWVDGLNAPKGLALRGKQLFVSDINQLVVIDVEKAEIVKKFSAAEDSFLNDVAIASNGTVFVTDTANNRIYRLNQGEFKVWLEDPRLASPNGAYIDNQHLMIASWGNPTDGWKTDVPGHVLMVSLETKEITDFGTSQSVGNLDGIVKLTDNSFLLTDWMTGKVSRIDVDGSVDVLLELNPGAADMLFLRSKKMLLIPQMKDGVLTAYHLEHHK